MATVLVVDDDAETLKSIRLALESLMPGMKVLGTRTGKQGLEILKNGGIDAILSDYRMSAMDGLQFLAAAKAMRPWTPGALMTSFPYATPEIGSWAKADVKQVLLKPFATQQLVETVVQLLSLRRHGHPPGFLHGRPRARRARRSKKAELDGQVTLGASGGP